MNPHRRRVITKAWDDYEQGYCTRREAESLELQMLQDQQRERELFTDTKIVVDCSRCGGPIELPALAYRGENRHACAACVGASGYPAFAETEQVTV